MKHQELPVIEIISIQDRFEDGKWVGQDVVYNLIYPPIERIEFTSIIDLNKIC